MEKCHDFGSLLYHAVRRYLQLERRMLGYLTNGGKEKCRKEAGVTWGSKPEELRKPPTTSTRIIGVHICLLKLVTEDKSEGRRRQERRRKQLLDDLQARRRGRNLKEKALYHTVWRTRFGRGYGAVLTLNIPRGVLWGPQRVIFCDPAVTISTNLLLIFVCVPQELEINIM